MNIAMINGSPKLGKSNSSFMLKALEPLICAADNEITYYNVNRKPLTEEQASELCRMDSIILAFPLYIDAIPSHLFRMLVSLEAYMKTERQKDIYVYVLANNGFYEGRQNHIAFEIINNWCTRCGLTFGQGIGQGAGEMLGSLENAPLGHGPLKNLGTAINTLAENIKSQRADQSLMFSPNFPHFAWMFAATHFFWNPEAKKNGLKRKDILTKL